MFTNSNDLLTGRKPVLTPAGCEVVAQRGAIALVAGDLDLNDIGFINVLPAGCVPVSIIVDSDKLDTGTPAVTMALGFINDDGDDLATTLVAGIDTSKAGGAAQFITKDLVRLAPAQVDRKIALKITATPAAKAAGTVGVTLLYRAS